MEAMHVAFSITLKSKLFHYFLNGFLSCYLESNKFFIVLDNARSHHSKQLKDFLESNKAQLELVFYRNIP
ncbi:MAG: transposase [Candidatus Helarchaeota archaeon]